MRVPVTPHPLKHLVLPLFCFFSHSNSCTAVSHWFNKHYLSAGDKGDVHLITGLERSPGRGNGHPLHYSFLENPMDRGAWRPVVHGVTKSWTWLSNWVCMHTHVLYHMYFFQNIEPTLHTWDKSQMLVVYNFFIYCWI